MNFLSLDDLFPAVTNLQVLKVGPSSITIGWDVSQLSMNIDIMRNDVMYMWYV